MAWAYWGSKERVAIGLGKDRLRLLVARGNGSVSVAHSDSRALPHGALRGGLRAPVFADRQAIAVALNELLDDARAAGLLRRRPDLVALGDYRWLGQGRSGTDPGQDTRSCRG